MATIFRINSSNYLRWFSGRLWCEDHWLFWIIGWRLEWRWFGLFYQDPYRPLKYHWCQIHINWSSSLDLPVGNILVIRLGELMVVLLIVWKCFLLVLIIRWSAKFIHLRYRNDHDVGQLWFSFDCVFEGSSVLTGGSLCRIKPVWLRLRLLVQG